jgi:signal transduction histidine kinase/ActR/RegA family two-component response regulator
VEDHADLTPDRSEAAEARRAAELALSRGHSRGADSPAQHIGVPLVLAGTVRGVVVARLTRQQVGAQAELTESLRALAPQIAVALDYGRPPHRSGADSPDAVARPDALREGAGALGHELNNLLASICLQAEVGLDLAEDSEVQESFQSVRTGVLKAARIVQRLQGLTGPALSAPSGELVDMGELVRDVLERQWPVWHDQAALSGVMLLLRSELGDDLHVLGSRSELRDLVMKLMQNALEAMPRGGEMDLQLLRAGQEVILRVRDTGLGMTPEVLEHACDPFYSSKHDDHVGLGLAVARSVCVAGHGRLVLSSEVDVGTTVEAVFPVANAAASRQAAGSRQDAARPDTTDETPLATLSVLVADDDPSFLHSMVLLLRRLGHRVSSACDGREATNLLRYGGPFDILLLDLSMPEMGGWEVAGLARKLQPQAAVLLLTGWGEQAATVNDGRLDRVLAKPISLEALAEALDGLEACRQGQSSIPAARVSSA